MKTILYLFCFLGVLAVSAATLPVMAYETNCNCTNQSMIVVSDRNTSWVAVPPGFPQHVTIAPAPPFSGNILTSGSPPPQWIWPYASISGTAQDGRYNLTRTFRFNNSCCLVNLNATINISADDEYALSFNNHYVGYHAMIPGPVCGATSNSWNRPSEESYPIPAAWIKTTNTINISTQNNGFACAPSPMNASVKFRLNITYVNCCPNETFYNPSSPVRGICGSTQEVLSDSSDVTPAVTTRSAIWPFSLLGGT